MTYHTLRTTAKPGAPLVFAFHGTGGDEHQFAALVADILPDAGLIAPRGDVQEHGANRYFRRTGEGVYDMGDLARRTEAMADFVRAERARHPEAPACASVAANARPIPDDAPVTSATLPARSNKAVVPTLVILRCGRVRMLQWENTCAIGRPRCAHALPCLRDARCGP